MEVHGSADSDAAGMDDNLPLRSVEPGVEFPTGKPYTFFMDRFAAAFRTELATFVEVVAGTRPSRCTIDDAQETGGSPRPRRSLWPSTSPSASRKHGTG
jgi:myo-inositol 2-dehydrogenase / D-chiro-inositol 1-dehydrogenase